MTPINQWINYHHLYYFKTIAEEGTVSRAAQKLRLGQPTLSAQLKQFEESLGVQLFERKQKRLMLTEQGRVALDYARSIFQMGSEMVEVLNDRLKPTKPTLHIGALDSIPKQIIVHMTKQALRISPCQVSLLEGKSDEMIRELSAHRIDLVLTNFLPTGLDAKGLFSRSVAKNNVAFYGAPQFRNLRKDFPKSVSGQAMILPTHDSKLRSDLEHWARLHEIDLNVVVESQDISMKKLIAVNGMGLIATASHTVSRQILSGDLVEVGKLQGVSEELFLLSVKRKIENPIAKELFKSFKI